MMKISQKKRNLSIFLLLVVIHIILVQISPQYELYLLGISFYDVGRLLFCFEILLIGCYFFTKVRQSVKNNHYKDKLCLMITALFIFLGIGAVVGSSQLCNHIRFYEIQPEGDLCDKKIIIKEYRLFYKTAGTYYVKISPFLLKKIPQSSFGEQAGVFPFGSGACQAVYDKETNVLQIYRTDAQAPYLYQIIPLVDTIPIQ